jgi:hypothetical protein
MDSVKRFSTISFFINPSHIGFAYGFVFAEIIASKVVKIQYVSAEFYNEFEYFLGEYEAICETARGPVENATPFLLLPHVCAWILGAVVALFILCRGFIIVLKQ